MPLIRSVARRAVPWRAAPRSAPGPSPRPGWGLGEGPIVPVVVAFLWVGQPPPLAADQPLALSDLNRSKASFGFMLLCTTAATAAIIAFGASDWKMLRPMSTPAAPCCTAL